MFYRLENGAARLFNDDGSVVTRLEDGPVVWPLNSDVSARYENPEGIVLCVHDAKVLGINPE